MEKGDLAIIKPRCEWENDGTRCSCTLCNKDFRPGDVVVLLDVQESGFSRNWSYLPRLYKVLNTETGSIFWITWDKLEQVEQCITEYNICLLKEDSDIEKAYI